MEFEKMRGKSVNLFLMDGEASGRIKCSISNWTGISYKIPRTDLEKCKDRDDLKKSGILIEAQCVRTKDGFTVLKGSLIEKIDSHAIEKVNTIKNARKIASIDENGILLEDITFSSPSYAGAFAIGSTINGQTEWKTKDGQSLKDYDAEMLKETN